MLKFEVNGKHGDKVLTFPTNLSELTPEYFSCVSDLIEPSENYSLIALAHKEKLSAFVLAGRNKKSEMSTAVVPIFVKNSKLTQSFNNKAFTNGLRTGERIIITPTDMELGSHVNLPKNTLNMSTLLYFIEDDGYAYQRALKESDYIYFLEYKLIPDSAIRGVFKQDEFTDFDNPFAVKDTESRTDSED